MTLSFGSVLSDGTSATGSEKAILGFSKKIVTLNTAVNKILSGDKTLSNTKSVKYIGMIGILELLNDVDVCNIINYTLGQLSLSKLKPSGKLSNNINKIKTTAFNLSGTINKLYTSSNLLNPSQGKVFDTENQLDQKDQIRKNFLEIRDILNQNLTPEVLSFIATIPGGEDATKTVNDILIFLNTNANITQLPSGQLNDVFSTINKLYSILVAVSSLQSAQSIVALFPNLQQQINKVQQVINPTRILPTLRGFLNSLKTIQQICNNILKIVNMIRTIAKILVVVRQAISIAISIFESNPLPTSIPGQFQPGGPTLGAISSLESAKNSLIEKETELGKILTEIITLTSIMIIFITDIVSQVQQMIIEVQKLIITLEQCGVLQGNDDSGLINDFNNTIKSLQETINELKGFTDAYAAVPQDPNLFRFAGYVIKIVDEELVDEGIKNKRRRAIAFDNKGIMVEQGELTFASDKRVLVEELKLKLLKEGLITDLSFAITDGIPLNIVNTLQLTTI